MTTLTINSENSLQDAIGILRELYIRNRYLKLDVKIGKARSLDQNARMWSMLGEVSKQVVWHGRKLSPEDWKHVFTASLHKMDVVPNIEGNGFVMLGLSTSKMTKQQLGDLMTLIEAFGAERNVKFEFTTE